ncbi:Tyrocidine synthase 1 [compost metagenome]
MQIVIRKWHDDAGFQLDIDYKTEEYTAWQVQQLFVRMERLAKWVVEHEQLHVSDLCLLTDKELEIFVKQYNQTDCDDSADTTVVDLFKESVLRNPHKIAVSMDQIALTYRQLDEKSDALAAFLSSKGMKNSCVVPLVVTHSPETVIAILGVLKIGAAYLPIDPEYPVERISYMLKDSGAELVLSNIAELNTGDYKGEVINLNEASLYSQVQNWKNHCKAKDLAYIIYTSGSTGKPKGVMIDHQNLTHYATWARKEYVTEETEVFPLYSSLAFDLTVTSIFTPLISGGTIRVYKDNADEYILKRIVQDGFCTLLKLTPAHMRILKDYDNSRSTIRKLIVGGEQLNVDIASSVYESFSGNIEIFNEYGPTEATVGCMIYRYKNTSNKTGNVPIGRPADNMRIYILDRNMMPRPPGEVGELYISGAGVARGYLNNPELTSERFLTHMELDHQRLYKTGDLAKFIAPDCIEYIGRKDFQLKLNGYRIELNEIEYHLRSYEGVIDAVATDYKNKNTHYLCAYYVAEKVMDETKLKQHLAQKLPAYMIPQVYIHLKEIPLNINRKVDKTLLPSPLIHIQTDSIDRPTGDKEAILLSVASEMIGRQLDDLGLNYFQAGGDSIIAILMSSRLKDKGYELKAKDILSKPVFGEMVLYMSQVAKEEIPQHSCEGFIPLTPIINWFMEQNLRFPGKYCQRVQIVLSPEFTVDALEMILQRLVKHHDTLRANWSKRENRLFYNPLHQNSSVKIQVLDQADRTSTKDLQLDEDLLVYTSLHMGGERNIWEITIHHFVVDGVSWRIMLEDLDTMLQQLRAGQPLKLPNKTHSYQAWAKATEAASDQFDNEYEYWKNALASSFSYPIVNPDYPKDDIAAATFQLDRMLTESLLSHANRSFHTRPDELLIAALLIALQESTEQTDLLIELENHGRGAVAEQLDISRSVGWFTALYPFRVILEQESLSEQIKAIKEALRSVPNNGIGYGWCRSLNRRWQYEKPRIRFNYLGKFQSEYNSFNVLPCLFDPKSNPNHTALLQIDCLIIDQQLNIAVSGSKRNVQQDTTRAFLQIFEQTIKQVIAFCSNSEKVEYTPSDFDGVQLSQKELDNLLS